MSISRIIPIAAGSRRLGCGLVLLLCLLAGCARPPHTAIRLGIAGSPTNLDPRFATDATSARIDRLLYARLVDFDDHFDPVPALADWQRLDATHYRFHLRSGPGRTFHDGSRLTARDVKATYDYVLDPAHASPHRTGLALIRDIRVLDPDTLEFSLDHPDPLFPGYLVLGILPARAMAAGRDFNRRPLGSGPLRFLARPDQDRLMLQRIRDGQTIEILRVKDATVRVLKLLRGELDIVQNDLPAELLAYLDRKPGIRVTRVRGTNFSYIGFNLKDPLTGKRAFRAAVGHGIDRRRIVRYLLAGAARLAGALLPPEHWAGAPGLHGLDYDPQQARALLHGLGFDRLHPAEVTYKTSSNALRIRIATAIQDQLRRVGIRVRLQTYDWGTFYGDIKAGRFQMYSLSWVGIQTPDIFRYIFHSRSVPPAGANRGRYADAETDRLIEAAARAPDRARQARLYRRLQRRLAQTLPYVPLWYEDHVFAARRDIVGYHLGTTGDYDGLLSVHRRTGRKTS